MKIENFIYNNDFSVSVLSSFDGDLLFVAVDLAKILDYADQRNALKLLDDDEKLTVLLDRSGQKRKTWMVNESGLYHLIIKSNKPEAKSFRKWITKEVLPALRRTGRYSNDVIAQKESDLQEVNVLMQKKRESINSTETILKNLKNDYRVLEKEFWEKFESSPNEPKLFPKKELENIKVLPE